MTEYFLLPLAAFLAGLIDAVAGGGGLIQFPALFIAFPQAPIALLLGTNKAVSMTGTTMATFRYARAGKIFIRIVAPAVVIAFCMSVAGARTASTIDPHVMKRLVLVLLVIVWIFTIVRSEFGSEHKPHPHSRRTEIVRVLLIAIVFGFYDGFFGPGMGSFLIVAFISLFGFDYVHASAHAKVINLATNLGAFSFFAFSGNVNYLLALPMAVANIAGGYAGSHLALRRGSVFVRRLLLLSVGLVILTLAWDVLK